MHNSHSNTKLKSQSSKKRTFILFLLVVVIVAVCLVFNKVLTQSRSSKSLTPKTYEEAVASGEEPVVDKKIVSVAINIDASKLSISDLKSYSNGISKRSGLESGDYQVEVISGGNQVYLDYFNKPKEVYGETVDPETGRYQQSEKIVQKVVHLALPWFGDDSKLVIKDNKGKVVLQRSLNDIPKVENKPDYKVYQ